MHEVVARSPSLLMRRIFASDAAVFLRLSQEASLREWIPDQVYRDEAEAEAVTRYLISQYDAGIPPRAPHVLAVCLAASGELIGHVGFSAVGTDVEVGYAIAMQHQRRGLATECLRATVPWALTAFSLPSVIGVVAVDNHASWRVLERCGFRLENERERKLHGRVRPVRQYRYQP